MPFIRMVFFVVIMEQFVAKDIIISRTFITATNYENSLTRLLARIASATHFDFEGRL